MLSQHLSDIGSLWYAVLLYHEKVAAIKPETDKDTKL